MALHPVPQLLDEGEVGLVDGQHKIALLVREQGLDHVDGRHIGGAHLTDEEHGPGHLRDEMELLGTDIDVPQQDIVGDDALDKGGLVVLLLIVGLGPPLKATTAMAHREPAISSSPCTKAA